MRNTIFILLLLFAQAACTPEQEVHQETFGKKSHIIIAKDVRLAYGIPPNITFDLLEVYQKEASSGEERDQAVKALLEKYNALENKKEELSIEQKRELGIEKNEEISNILDYDLFISTKGNQSPAIYAPGGYVEVWYGIPKEAFKGIWQLLEEKQVAVESFSEILEERIEKFNELEAELSKRPDYDDDANEARMLLAKGDTEGAERILRKVAQDLGEPAAFSFYELALVEELNLKYQEANEHYMLAAKIEKENPDYTFSYGNNLTKNGKYDEAIEQIQLSLKALPQEDSLRKEVALRYNNLGSAYALKAAYDTSIVYFNKALAIWLNDFGEEYPDIGEALNNLGYAYVYKGQYDRGLEYFNQALNTELKVLGEHHPDVARTYNNLGEVYRIKGNYDQALEYYKKSLAIFSETIEHNHPNIAASYNNLGLTYFYQEKCDTAIIYYQRAKKIWAGIFSESHPNIASNNHNLGAAYFCAERPDEALTYYEKALANWQSVVGENHPSVAAVYNGMGKVFSSKKEYNKAIFHFDKSLAILGKTVGEDHPNTSKVYNSQGEAYKAIGEKEKALQLFKKAESILIKSSLSEHPDMKVIQENIKSI